MEIEKKQSFNVLIRLTIICCATILTGIISLYGVTTKITLLGMIISFFIFITIEFRYNFLHNCFDNFNKKIFMFSITLTGLIIYFNKVSITYRWYHELLSISQKHNLHFIKSSNIDNFIIIGTCFAGVAACILIYWSVTNVISDLLLFVQELDKIDKIYLITWTSILALAIIFIYSKTTAFYSPTYTINNVEKLAPWDVVYSLDTPDILNNNYLFDVYYGDLGHSLFSLIMIPIGTILKVLSSLYHVKNSFAIVLAIFNVLLLNISTILTKKLLNTNWALVLMSFSHPFLFFSFGPERYQITTFAIIFFAYFCVKKSYKDRIRVVPMLAGTTITSIALIPFIEDFKNKKEWIKNIIKAILIFVMVLITSGRIGILTTSIIQFIGKMSVHAKPTPFLEKLTQYPTFITSCIFATPYKVIKIEYYRFTWDVQGSVDIIGILILIFVLLTFYKRREDKYVQVCAYWIAFSFALLPIAGWGVGEFPLFSIFFSWAVISLLYIGIDNLCKNNPRVKHAIIAFIIINMIFVNLAAIYDLVKFSIYYYSILR